MKKLYYSIGEVSEITGLEPHVLRYWETTFPELKPGKNKAGKRIYTDNDIKLIIQLKDLVRDQQYSTKGAAKAINRSGEAERQMVKLPSEAVRDLRAVRQFLQTMLDEI
jgi:DNA-binding transcriptional MerR regulator